MKDLSEQLTDLTAAAYEEQVNIPLSIKNSDSIPELNAHSKTVGNAIQYHATDANQDMQKAMTVKLSYLYVQNETQQINSAKIALNVLMLMATEVSFD